MINQVTNQAINMHGGKAADSGHFKGAAAIVVTPARYRLTVSIVEHAWLASASVLQNATRNLLHQPTVLRQKSVKALK